MNWIRDLWIGYAAGRPGVTVELVTHPNTPQRPVVLNIPGTTLANEVVILGGHLDSIASGTSNPNFSAPGADDDASGIATISEAARVLLASDFQPQRTLRIIGDAAEEVGLRGSSNLAATYQAAGVNVVAVLQQDITAYHGSNEDVAFITDFTNVNLTASSSTCSRPTSRTSTGRRRLAATPAPITPPGTTAATRRHSPLRPGSARTTLRSTPPETPSRPSATTAHAVKFARLAAAFLVETGRDGLPSNELFSDGSKQGTPTPGRSPRRSTAWASINVQPGFAER